MRGPMRGLSARVLPRPTILTARYARLSTPKQYSTKDQQAASSSTDDFMKAYSDVTPKDEGSKAEVSPKGQVLEPGSVQRWTTQAFRIQSTWKGLSPFAFQDHKRKLAENAAIRRLNVEYTEAWWQQQDLRYGPGWAEHFPSFEREIANAMRKYLDQWPAHISKTTDSARVHYTITVQLRRLRQEYSRLQQRFNTGDIVRHRLQMSLQRTEHETKPLAGLIKHSLAELAWMDHLEVKHGTDWVGVYNHLRRMHSARINRTRELDKAWQSIKAGALLARDTERVLAQLRWYDALEREHGADWEQIAKATVAQWTRDWDKTLCPVDLEYTIHRYLRRSDFLWHTCVIVLQELTFFRFDGREIRDQEQTKELGQSMETEKRGWTEDEGTSKIDEKMVDEQTLESCPS